jgi:hypothetical protein
MFEFVVLSYVGAVVVAVTLGVFYPVMAWAAVRQLKGIRVQLEHLNAARDRGEPYTRTGPLNIR